MRGHILEGVPHPVEHGGEGAGDDVRRCALHTGVGPTSADIGAVNDVLHGVAANAVRDVGLPDLLLDEPQLMGVESIEVDTVNLRMVARTLPGKQFEVGRRLAGKCWQLPC